MWRTIDDGDDRKIIWSSVHLDLATPHFASIVELGVGREEGPQCRASARIVYVMLSTTAEATHVSPFISRAGLLSCTCMSFVRKCEYVKAYTLYQGVMLVHTFYPISPSNYALWQYHASYQTILTEDALGRLNFHSRSSFVPRIEFLRGGNSSRYSCLPREPNHMEAGHLDGFPTEGQEGKKGQAVEREGRTEAGYIFFPLSLSSTCTECSAAWGPVQPRRKLKCIPFCGRTWLGWGDEGDEKQKGFSFRHPQIRACPA